MQILLYIENHTQLILNSFDLSTFHALTIYEVCLDFKLNEIWSVA